MDEFLGLSQHPPRDLTMTPAFRRVSSRVWRGGFAGGERSIAEEVPIALSFNRTSHAVMMATPADLEDFAIGFSLSEGIIDRAGDVEEFDVVVGQGGIECRMWVGTGLLERLERRRRLMAGPTGCGLCGLESLAEAVRAPAPVGPGLIVDAAQIQAAMAAMPAGQTLNAETKAVHAAGFWRPEAGMIAIREDVGRHNALDKLSGALARAGQDGASGIVLMTSRVSVELVQKAAAAGAAILVAVSAPTALALDVAETAGMTVVGIARRDGFEVFTHPHRIRGGD